MLAVERRAFSRTGGLRGPSCPPRRAVSVTAVPVWDRQCLLSADFKVLDMSHSSPVPPRSDSVHSPDREPERLLGDGPQAH